MGTAVRLLSATFVAVVAATTVASPSFASPIDGTDPTQPGSPDTTRLVTEMRVVDFDADVAKKNGYEVVQLPDGRMASVPQEEASAARSGTYRPQGEDTKYGDCGLSFVELYDRGGSVNNAEMRTGWTIYEPVVSQHWLMFWSSPGGNNSGNRTWQDGNVPGLTFWQSGIFKRTFGIGLASAEVDTESFVITASGGVCTSLGPATVEWFGL